MMIFYNLYQTILKLITFNSFVSISNKISNANTNLSLPSNKLQILSDKRVGSIGLFLSGKYIVEIRFVKDSHKSNTSSNCYIEI